MNELVICAGQKGMLPRLRYRLARFRKFNDWFDRVCALVQALQHASVRMEWPFVKVKLPDGFLLQTTLCQCVFEVVALGRQNKTVGWEAQALDEEGDVG